MPDHDKRTRHGAVRVTPGGSPVIHTAAWLALRTRGVHEGLTRDLHTWARRHHLRTTPGNLNNPAERAWAELATTWCRESHYGLTASSLIVHTASRLDAEIWVLPAATIDGRRIVIVGIEARSPTIYADGCRDSWAWRDADSLVITCPMGHGWTWRTGRELLTTTGRATTLTAVFGSDLDAPFTTCPTCAGVITHPDEDRSTDHEDDGARVCGCDRDPWIVCPACGQVCTLTLPTP
jgi:hypothetical protein